MTIPLSAVVVAILERSEISEVSSSDVSSIKFRSVPVPISLTSLFFLESNNSSGELNCRFLATSFDSHWCRRRCFTHNRISVRDTLLFPNSILSKFLTWGPLSFNHCSFILFIESLDKRL